MWSVREGASASRPQRFSVLPRGGAVLRVERRLMQDWYCPGPLMDADVDLNLHNYGVKWGAITPV